MLVASFFIYGVHCLRDDEDVRVFLAKDLKEGDKNTFPSSKGASREALERERENQTVYFFDYRKKSLFSLNEMN